MIAELFTANDNSKYDAGFYIELYNRKYLLLVDITKSSSKKHTGKKFEGFAQNEWLFKLDNETLWKAGRSLIRLKDALPETSAVWMVDIGVNDRDITHQADQALYVEWLAIGLSCEVKSKAQGITRNQVRESLEKGSDALQIFEQLHVAVFCASRLLAKETFTKDELKEKIKEKFDITESIVWKIYTANCEIEKEEEIYNYLWCTEDKKLRLYKPDEDEADPSREDAPKAPRKGEVPEVYQKFLSSGGGNDE